MDCLAEAVTKNMATGMEVFDHDELVSVNFGQCCPKVTVKIIGHVVTAEKFVPGDINGGSRTRNGYGISFDRYRSLLYGRFGLFKAIWHIHAELKTRVYHFKYGVSSALRIGQVILSFL